MGIVIHIDGGPEVVGEIPDGVFVFQNAQAEAYYSALESANVGPIDAQTLYTITEDQLKSGVDQYFIDGVDNGWLSLIDAEYPEIGGTATTHKFNMINPVASDAAFRLSFNGGWIHSATGSKPNGLNAWADTHLIPSSVLSLNDTSIAYYSGTDESTGGLASIGVRSGADLFMQLKDSTTARAAVNIPIITSLDFGALDSLGWYEASRLTSIISEYRKDGVLRDTNNVPSSSLPTRSIYLGALNLNGSAAAFSGKECRQAHIGGSLTVSQSLSKYNSLQTLQTLLGGRNV